ncbi:branched-chain amino acid aminotransferase [Loktanella sp. 5RATIMAR09]|uniref:sulfotransferase-like domain-containing protein n=1 Tax=Loktanella sp. 5RATIMAR09 TaxID=1225655 RepID=UPI0006EB8286|nr:sulfotransferase family protein [Loktanella sp. 5RATIMAR09]KQI73874.1 branched-chain amino acid aminotransferase [Loktanella sp. 5RATIMAR09]
MRIAMWSGPRNLSTAMMYAFGNRADFAVWDEPFYAPYLKVTGANHPMRADIIAGHETDPTIVAQRCLDTIPAEKPHFYMKHMPHHMIAGFPLDWARDCINIHLIRHPARVIASYGAKRDEMTLEDIGFTQQAALYDQIGGLVIDSADIRADPGTMLEKLCDAIDLNFDPAMLAWPAGPRAVDGVWAAHWYNAVHQSTGFASAEGPLPTVDAKHRQMLAKAIPLYEKMQARKL